jgi:hypothetical protein
MDARFIRLPAGTAGGTKLCGRDQVNLALSHEEGMDVARFGRELAARLGPPDQVGDTDYSYSIRDTQTGVEFEAYAAQSGPAYGGSPSESYTDFESGDYRLKQDVLRTLTEFESWLEG